MNAAILEQLSKLESVPEDWESSGASPPNCTARVNARRVIELFLLAGCVPDNVDPSTDEGVCVSLSRGDRYAGIECYNDGVMFAYLSRDDTVDVSQLWEVKPGEMVNAVQKIRQFFMKDPVSNEHETLGEKHEREHPWHWRWARFKLAVEDFLHKYLKIDIDW